MSLVDAQATPPPTTAARSPKAREPVRNMWNGWARPRFLACIAVMLVAGFSLYVLPKMFDLTPHKLSLPLRQPLDRLDKALLAPEYGLHASQPDPFSGETIETLGTDQYLSWNLVCRGRDRSDAAYLSNVVVTYYTGQPDMVPHVPQECMQATGFQLEHEWTDTIQVTGVGAPGDQIKIKVCEFSPAQGGADRSSWRRVLYLFYCNGRFETERLGVQIAQANFKDKYAYYSKIELNFFGESGHRNATREESVAAAQPLLQKLLPALLAHHYQNWADITAGKAPVIE